MSKKKLTGIIVACTIVIVVAIVIAICPRCDDNNTNDTPCTCYSYTLKRYIPCEQATAICRDGTCSISQSRSGTCSWHGGVARWIN